VNVSITKIASSYPSNPPFNPSDSYPEYPVDKISRIENQVYGAVRNNLFYSVMIKIIMALLSGTP
jgi:hypothetical protein